ncbi:DoxX family protein [Elizabethkingia anophelis]|uniref:Membrane protein n=1 Tax=Elizabethkingia anophelis TaxID=1117645 RepID=A0A455ZCU0_9FLAO|nr:DoxX family protein [Elizabethkingia anophelis]DAC74669.1 TPA_exp: membrane protein [Elizabethkingia anophelis]
MSQKTIRITGWVLTIILGLLFTMSAFMKLTQNETALAQASSFGIDATTYQFIGLIEIISLILFLIPRTAVLGTLLLVAYLGGAIVTHLQHQESIAMAVIIQIVLWITAAIRFPELRHRLLTTKNKY